MGRKEILLDAARRLFESNVPEEDVVESLREIGVSGAEAMQIAAEAREGAEKGDEEGHGDVLADIIPEKERGRDETFDEWQGDEPWGEETQQEFKAGKDGEAGEVRELKPESIITEEMEEEIEELERKIPEKSRAGKAGKGTVQREGLKRAAGEVGQARGAAPKVAVAEAGVQEAAHGAADAEVMPLNVGLFDRLIGKGGARRGETIVISGGCGTGKTTFAVQSVYNSAMRGGKCAYITFGESAEKIKRNMLSNFGWDLGRLEDEGQLAIIDLNPLEVADAAAGGSGRGHGILGRGNGRAGATPSLNLPFRPDRVVVDGISSLSDAFGEDRHGCRQYLGSLIGAVRKYGSLNLAVEEIEQEPGAYKRVQMEEFLADGIIVLYNVRMRNMRERALEILKLRSSDHWKGVVPYKITGGGIEVCVSQEPPDEGQGAVFHR